MKAFSSFSAVIILLFTLLCSVNAIATEPPADNEGTPVSQVTAEWILIKDMNGLQVFAKKTECNDFSNGLYREFVLLKFVNTTAMNLRAEWQMELWYNDECLTCGQLKSEEYHYTLDVAAGEAREGSCSLDSPREVSLFLRYLNYPHIAKLTKFNFANLAVNPR
jgi:hypothetical protein